MICPQQFTWSTLQRHNTENSKQIFLGKELRGYSPNSYIHDSVSDLYIPLIGLLILLQENRWAERGGSLSDIWIVEIWTEAAQFFFLGIHKSKFLCSVKKENRQQASVTLPNESLFEAYTLGLGMKGDFRGNHTSFLNAEMSQMA